MSRRDMVIGVAMGLYLLGAGFLGGTIVDRIRFDRQRAAALARLDEATRQVHARLITLEQGATRSGAPSSNELAMRP